MKRVPEPVTDDEAKAFVAVLVRMNCKQLCAVLGYLMHRITELRP